MKLWKICSILALGAGLFVSCGEGDVIDISSHTVTLAVAPTAQKIAPDGSASFTFSVNVQNGLSGQALDMSHYTATLNFEATGGSVSPASATTDASGRVSVTFTTPDPQGFTGGTVKGTVIKVKEDKQDGLFQQGNLATATASVLPLDAEDPGEGPIEKAKKLKDNTYSIQKKGGDAHVYDLPQQYSSWYVGTSWMDGTKQCIHVECMDEDEEQRTMGWLNGEIPLEVANKLTTINQEFCSKYPWASAKLGTMRLGQDNMIDAHMGEGGNVKLDGSSQFYLKEKGGTKAYSGQYQFLVVLEFENQTWDQESESYLPGGEEYTLCINATLDQLVADLDYFRLDYPNNWIAPGESITLTASWTAGASFDWSKVTLDSQTRNYSSGDWFSWDASTQKLTAKTSADNQEVELTFGYKGTNMTDKITIYNGPGYTSFSIVPRDGSSDYLVAENDPQGWSSNDYVYISVDSFTPNDYYSFNYHSIEIDPASDYYDKLYYNDYGPYVQFNHTIPAGEFNMILRSKADHSVKFTIPVKVVHHKATSFQITYKHSNGAFEPWTSGGENGICNYPMGMEVGVITDPEDAYWNWADVELAYDYDGFTFSGYGGKEDHPKLQRTKSNPGGGTSYGTQIIFRLKWDNRKKSTIYVDHN
jgi:hypothetical protein